MDGGTTNPMPTPSPAMCECNCVECAAGTCAACSHKSSEEGCNCAGCTCNMETSAPPMAM